MEIKEKHKHWNPSTLRELSFTKFANSGRFCEKKFPRKLIALWYTRKIKNTKGKNKVHSTENPDTYT